MLHKSNLRAPPAHLNFNKIQILLLVTLLHLYTMLFGLTSEKNNLKFIVFIYVSYNINKPAYFVSKSKKRLDTELVDRYKAFTVYFKFTMI